MMERIEFWEDLNTFQKVLGIKDDNSLGDMNVDFRSHEIMGVFCGRGVVVNEMRQMDGKMKSLR